MSNMGTPKSKHISVKRGTNCERDVWKNVEVRTLSTRGRSKGGGNFNSSSLLKENHQKSIRLLWEKRKHHACPRDLGKGEGTAPESGCRWGHIIQCTGFKPEHDNRFS